MLIIIAIILGLFVGVGGGFIVLSRNNTAQKKGIENIIEANKYKHPAIILNYVKQYLEGI